MGEVHQSNKIGFRDVQRGTDPSLDCRKHELESDMVSFVTVGFNRFTGKNGHNPQLS